MRKAKSKIYAADFETTVFDGQDFTEVWAACCCELYTEEAQLFHSIDEQFKYFQEQKENIIAYYHNLKFDGSFWLNYLLKNGYEQAYKDYDPNDADKLTWIPQKDMKNKQFIYSISSMGQWYRILVKTHNHFIEFRDSLKLLPFTLKTIGKSFGTKHQKLDMEYKGFRYAGCQITEQEKEYILNDVYVLKEALEIMFTEGHNKLTIGSCCLSEYKTIIGKDWYEEYFPNLYEISIDKELYGSENAGEYIRGAYRGGWCYVVKGKERKIFHNGTTADVNSLYPSMMSSESGNIYPIGKPVFWKGNIIPKEAKKEGNYYFLRVRTRFYIKDGKLPFIQIKNTLRYRVTEMLETSDVYNAQIKKYCRFIYDLDGNYIPAYVTLTMTMTDWQLFNEHYNLEETEILDGCYFMGMCGIFDDYIEKYKKIKLENKGAKRELAKLFLNNLYGKMAANTDSSFKVAYIKEDGSLGYYTVLQNEKKPGYIAIGAAITSYARNFTIRAAQKNYYGVDKPGFIYADTDSIHCDLPESELKGIIIHPKNFCCWKVESYWDTGLFVRQKTYIEHITHKDGVELETPKYDVKCAGMPTKCKNLFIASMTQQYDPSQYENEELEFVRKKRSLTDFDYGLVVPGKLLPKNIKGGIVLAETTYEMR